MRLFCFLIQDETFLFSYPRWDFPVFLSKIRLSRFLIQDKTFRFSYPRWDFLVFLSKMRLSSFLIQDKTFRILIQDKNLTECILKEEEKAHTKTAGTSRSKIFSYLSDLTLNKYLSYGFLHSQRATASKKEFVSAMISRANLKGTQCPQIIYEAQLHSSLYSKASRYTALSCTDLAGASFWMGSKKIWDERIYEVKTLSSTVFWSSCLHPIK